MNRIASFLLAAALLTSVSCTSAPLVIQTPPVGPNEQVLGKVTGSSTGLMLLQFIPIKQNSRFQDAYNEAIQSKGATRLVNPTIQERWFWAYILNGYSFTVSGTAVKNKN